ncbi:hypothetical protein E1264_27305 [Actinomadura sp. KC216]|uniref:hypothetical protein n=1 Tax=Actinomadura sp. KC216 TaxID=2530370 RepID=UPI00104AC135|nr:hypothetical protein [Actinomadura sp. KC216]TDB83733.1 hypothetical protein E1264_27305 [Actinomadura sp. KC216]
MNLNQLRNRGDLQKKSTFAFLGVGIVVGCVYLSQPLWWYATGTSTKAVVERCVDPGRQPLSCTGRWTLPNGREARGKVAGAGNGDVGRTVQVRASTSHAAKLTLRLISGPLIMLLVITVLAYTSYRQRTRARAERGQAPSS